MKALVLTATCFMTVASPAMSSDQLRTLNADLDRDGRAETFTLTDDGESLTTLTIVRPGKTTIVARDIAWSLEPANLTRAANGSVWLNTSHVGIGRSPHDQTLTIAYRSGVYQVVGITRSNWDRIEPDTSTACDINLITGRGMVNGNPVRRPAGARPVVTWKWDQNLPRGCQIE
jgi:hypothetical protein